jgi:hypothetical protein
MREVGTKIHQALFMPEEGNSMTAGSIYDFNNGTEPQTRVQAPPIIDSSIVRILEEFAHKVEKEGDKATAKLAKQYGHNLSQRTPEIRWGTPGSSAIEVRRGFLGRKNPTDAARQETAKTIEDLTKLAVILQANQARFGDFAHQLLTELRRRLADRNYSLPDDIREYGQVIELICADRALRTFTDSLEMIETIGKTEIGRVMPKQNR